MVADEVEAFRQGPLAAPSSTIEPAGLGRRRPARIASRLDLPAPLRPVTSEASPAASPKERSIEDQAARTRRQARVLNADSLQRDRSPRAAAAF